MTLGPEPFHCLPLAFIFFFPPIESLIKAAKFLMVFLNSGCVQLYELHLLANLAEVCVRTLTKKDSVSPVFRFCVLSGVILVI